MIAFFEFLGAHKSLSVRCFGRLIFSVTFFPALAAADPQIDVRFTNPSCPSRAYEGYIAPVEVLSALSGRGIRFETPEFVSAVHVPLRNGNESRTSTKEGAYCFPQDAARTDERPDSVFQKLSGLIESMNSDDTIQVSTFSFSNSKVSSLLCSALERGVRVELVTGSASPLAEGLASGRCGGNAALRIDGAGASSGRLQHAKFIIFSDAQTGHSVVSIQSANISSGVNVHHENWTFVEAPSSDAFVQKHRCQFAALRDAHFNSPGQGLASFRSHYQNCLDGIPAASDVDIESFFVPAVTNGSADGKRALDQLTQEIGRSDEIDVISHHLTNRRLIDSLKLALDRGSRVRIIIDSEIFWVGNSAIPRNASGAPLFTSASGYPMIKDSSGLTVFDHYGTVAEAVRSCERGPAYALQEYDTLQELGRSGAKIRYFEANHREQLFQHNKFLVMRRGGAILSAFTGAGNFSQAGFGSNGENYYLVRNVPAATAFAAQYDRLWKEVATAPEDLPVTWATQVEGDSNWQRWSAKIFEEKRRVCP